MLTKNAYKMMGVRLFTTSAKIKVTQTNGTQTALYPSRYLYGLDSVMKSIGKNLISSGVVLGNGSIPPTMDDITLSGNQITTLACTSSVTPSYGEDGVVCTATYTITNSGDEDFTVSEIALLYSVYTSDTSSNSQAFMFDRTVLDEPVTIRAGSIGVVTYTIRMNYPT